MPKARSKKIKRRLFYGNRFTVLHDQNTDESTKKCSKCKVLDQLTEMAERPSTRKVVMVQKLTSNFRDAVTIETTEICHPQKGEVCVKIKYVGINASDVNLTKGRYFSDGKIPFGVGFEAIGEIAEVGEDVKNLEIGQNVAFLCSRRNAYAEYVCISVTEAFIIPEANPDYLAILASGLTAVIGLNQVAKITAGETVLITAAAGGLGHIAVQLAKAAYCHVIGTCSTEEKEKILKDLGCDRVINYKREDLSEVLSKEYPKGVNLIWESVGGKIFEDCLKNLAIKGRLLIVGGTSGYKTDNKEAFIKLNLSHLPEQLLFKSCSVIGYLLSHHKEFYACSYKYLCKKLQEGKLKIIVDDGLKSTGTEFLGLEGVTRGIEHLHAGKNVGKVIARIS